MDLCLCRPKWSLRVFEIRTKTDVLGMYGLVLELPNMVTSSVYNMRTKTGVIGIEVADFRG